MSGVVLRCPNCGTTRGTAGECEACHEAAVRYYCTNHAPGRWLESPACPQCGAAFGAATRPPAAAPAPARRPSTGSTTPRTPSAPAPGPSTAPGRAERPIGRPRTPEIEPRPLPFDDGPDVRMPRWQELLLAAARNARRPPDVETDRPRRGPLGCLFKLVLTAIFIVLALSAGAVLLGSALLRTLGF